MRDFYYPTQGDWIRYCKEVLHREEPLRDGFYSIDKDKREWRNFLSWYRRKVQKGEL
jgi:hypothetical protein